MITLKWAGCLTYSGGRRKVKILMEKPCE